MLFWKIFEYFQNSHFPEHLYVTRSNFYTSPVSTQIKINLHKMFILGP